LQDVHARLKRRMAFMKKRQSTVNRLILMILLFGFFCMISGMNITAEGEVPIKDAIDSQAISVSYVSNGEASGHIANLLITNEGNSDITLDLANSGLEGMVLKNPYDDEQDEIITETPGTSTGGSQYTPKDNETIGPGNTVIVPVIGYCMNFDKDTPTEGIEFDLSSTSDKTNINEISDVVDTLETFEFPEGTGVSSERDIKQMAIWTAQPENKQTPLSTYSDRGYTMDDTEIDVIKDILTQSGKDTSGAQALSGKSKEDVDEQEDFPMMYTFVPIIVVVIILVFVLSRRGQKKEAPEPRQPQRRSPQQKKATSKQKVEEKSKEEPKAKEEKPQEKETEKKESEPKEEPKEAEEPEEPELEEPEEPELEDEDKEEPEEEGELPEIEEDLLERDESEDKTPEE
jgi:hypothetical protein